MFDLGWTELLVIGIVALIVVGPKDLPGMFRTVGQFIGKAKGMAREFSKAMNDAADESGVSGMSDTLRKASNPIGSAIDEVRKSTKSFTEATRDAGKPKPKSKLSPERQDAKDKITAHSAKATQERLDREKAEAVAANTANSDAAKSIAPAQDGPKPAPAAKTTKKTAPKKATTKKPPAKRAVASKAASAPKAKPAAKKPATKTPSVKAAAPTASASKPAATKSAAAKPKSTKPTAKPARKTAKASSASSEGKA
ncbi:Sec-independent protein translocase protein TatB [Roseovarius sp. Pro17]|uniref:Sec-independent protein translocase protein TatB n=1 Tax=Roseovarius sp. Pro17 TaxID=3108175 RepID=UPI002D776079|nr:Sec-independent protein translocase protein TatB [Roseovarius sp. Pro17]